MMFRYSLFFFGIFFIMFLRFTYKIVLLQSIRLNYSYFNIIKL